ncbi:NAD-dependent DNA ligase LigA, partial [Candidatus Gracilibacteria bacterium]|nr:NAD-dependent DNA ligase LigA [Candidatus Gracilibacteria bacterium]
GLQEIIREHNKLYYNEESPVISDKEYDELFKILKSLEEKFNISNYNSPTQKIDVLLSKQFEKGKHKTPMLSLDNTYNSEDIHEFDKRILNILKNDEKLSYIIELKFDGLGISLTYKNGKLIRALTRGKGDEGEDVTINIMQISNIPKKIPFTHNEEIEIRGEIIMPIYEFEKLNKSRLDLGEKLFANPRNAASGSVRQLDYNITKSRNLKFFAYNFPYLENNFLEENILTYSEILDKLKSFGFSTSPYFFKARNIDEVIKEIEKVGTNKVNYEFETDGLVIKLDDLKKWKSLGFTEHHPRYSIAYKFPATNVRTKILDIEHSVGRTGILTPVAHLNPVNVSGVIVKRATLHNYDELQKKEIKLGDEVFIVRAGEVIPEVVSVIKEVRTGKEKEVIIPEFCPSCETRLKKDEGKVAWYCPNKKFCPAQTLGSLISFVSRSGANIEGLGDKIIELFIEKEFITDFVSIYHLKKFQNEILALEGFKDKKVSNILEEIENSRKMPLTNFLVALGIPQVGKKTAKLLANKISSKLENDKNSNLSEILFNLNSEELEEIKDIGPIGAHNVVYYFEEYSDLVSRLLNEINIILPEISNQTSSLPLNGKSFCVTGSFPDISRDEIHKIIEENGGETRTSVTKNLDYLVVGSEAGSKLAKAKEFNVQILSLEEFYKLIQK